MLDKDNSLQQVAKGTGIIFTGTLVGMLFGFAGRVMVARYWTQSEYGIFSLAFVILNLLVLLSTLGLREGSSRNIAYFRGKSEHEKVEDLLSSSLWLSLTTSLIFSFILFFASDYIAINIFHEPSLALPLKIISWGIPFFTLIQVLASVFLGFGYPRPKAYFQDILRNLTFPILLVPVVILWPYFINVFYAFLLSLAIPCILFFIYATRSYLIKSIKLPKTPVTKELLYFSLPLLSVIMLNFLIRWTDTLMLGGFKTSIEVGLYNAAYPLANFISVPLSALILIYMPIVSGLYARNELKNIRRDFSILTKWLSSATLPLFLFLFLFPQEVLNLLFGTEYHLAANVLRILSLGFIINNFMGPNSAALVAFGETRFIMWATSATTILNIALNLALIPVYSIMGAAVASLASITSINVMRCIKLYKVSMAQPVSKNLLKPAVVTVIISLGLKLLVTDINYLYLPLILILTYIVYGFSFLFTKSLEQEDWDMLLAMEKRTGIELKLIKSILKKFL
ncbi:MAG: flippase [Archaeoglobaceae archaeon]